jgi:ApaG protein
MPTVYTLNTDFMTVSVQPEYLEYESSPIDHRHIWAYHIRIHNNGKHAVQVLNRYWHITDGHGLVQEVKGPGVIGLQPVILSGEHFDYTSSVNLSTPSGIMHGSYEIKTIGGDSFEIQIPVFSLDSAEQLLMPN